MSQHSRNVFEHQFSVLLAARQQLILPAASAAPAGAAAAPSAWPSLAATSLGRAPCPRPLCSRRLRPAAKHTAQRNAASPPAKCQQASALNNHRAGALNAQGGVRRQHTCSKTQRATRSISAAEATVASQSTSTAFQPKRCSAHALPQVASACRHHRGHAGARIVEAEETVIPPDKIAALDSQRAAAERGLLINHFVAQHTNMSPTTNIRFLE